MARASSIIMGIINIVFLIIGIIVICKSLYVYASAETHCSKIQHGPFIIMSFIVIVVSFLGLMGIFFKDIHLVMLYLVFIFIIIVAIMVFTIFIFLVTDKVKGKAVPGLGFQVYKLEDFSKFLQKYTANEKIWENVRSCLVDAQICKSFTHNSVFHSESDLYKTTLSRLEGGCCMPPIACHLPYRNGTFWTMPIFENAKNDRDCTTWNSEDNSLCFDCNSCKGGFLANLIHQCRVLVLYNILIIAFLLLVYFIGCCARRSIKYRYVKYSPYIKA